MAQTLDAIFKDGTFKPVGNGSLPFSDGQRVRLTVEITPETEDDLIKLAGQVYQGLSEEEIVEIERLALDRGKFFRDRQSS